jgi:hypothetical protein
MKLTYSFIFVAVLAFKFVITVGAESWPTLDQFASDCVLVVKARQLGHFSGAEKSRLSFEVLETWKGQFNARDFVQTGPEGYIFAAQGEHGVRVAAGQEIVFFFTRHNQPEGKLQSHSAAFPIQNGRITYARTDDPPVRREMSIEDFKRVFDRFKAKP